MSETPIKKQEKRPMGRRVLIKYIKPTYRIYVCHTDKESKLYLLASTMIKKHHYYTKIQVMNYDEICMYKKLQQSFAIMITIKQFESIMALYHNQKQLAEYLIQEKLLTKNIPTSVRESIK
jgi:chorismate mutase